MALPWGKFSDLKCNLIKSALGCSTMVRGESKDHLIGNGWSGTLSVTERWG